jgi:DNA-binding winged helix-turn-helix (wHTH) protein
MGCVQRSAVACKALRSGARGRTPDHRYGRHDRWHREKGGLATVAGGRRLRPLRPSAMGSTASPRHYRFGAFELQLEGRRLLKDGAPISLRPRAFDLLAALVERAGQLVTKDELLARVWPRVVVEEAALHVQVSALRKVLGSDAITTVSGRGYQFTLQVTKGDREANRASRLLTPSPRHPRAGLNVIISDPSSSSSTSDAWAVKNSWRWKQNRKI